MEIPKFKPATVKDVQLFQRRGPWPSKSGGELNVLFSIGFDDIQNKFLHYEVSELAQVPEDVRGLRSYLVSNIDSGRIGANEWHRIRHELIFVMQGSVKWTFADVYGNSVEYIADSNTGIWSPPFIMHTYETLAESNNILVIANTLFNPENPATHDTFTAEQFTELQSHFQNSNS